MSSLSICSGFSSPFCTRSAICRAASVISQRKSSSMPVPGTFPCCGGVCHASVEPLLYVGRHVFNISYYPETDIVLHDVSSSMESKSNPIKAATSSDGRFQFSVENVYKVRYLTPNLAASSANDVHSLCAGLMSIAAFVSTLLGPPSVTVHDNRHVLGYPV